MPRYPFGKGTLSHTPRVHLSCSTETQPNLSSCSRLSNRTDTFCFPEETPSQVFGSQALSNLDFDSNYTVVVSASNKLGNASSQPLTFMLIDIGKAPHLSACPRPLGRPENIQGTLNLLVKSSIQPKPIILFSTLPSKLCCLSEPPLLLSVSVPVKPHPPEFLVEFDDSSATSCTFSWHDEARAQHYRLRYRPLSGHTWSVVILWGLRELQTCWRREGSRQSSEPPSGA